MIDPHSNRHGRRLFRSSPSCLDRKGVDGRHSPAMTNCFAVPIGTAPDWRMKTVTTASPDVVNEFAPAGRLRAAINLSNIVLVQKDPATGAPRGITPELA